MGYWERATVRKLTRAEYAYCVKKGKERAVYFKKGVKDGIFKKTQQQSLEADIFGACVEFAALIGLGLDPYQLTSSNHGLVDIAPQVNYPGAMPMYPNAVQVKGRTKDHALDYDNMLIPHKELSKKGWADTIFLCVHEIEKNVFAIRGFIWGDEIELFGRSDPGDHDKKAGREPAWDIPCKYMHRLPFYPGLEKHTRHGVDSKGAHNPSTGTSWKASSKHEPPSGGRTRSKTTRTAVKTADINGQSPSLWPEKKMLNDG